MCALITDGTGTTATNGPLGDYLVQLTDVRAAPEAP